MTDRIGIGQQIGNYRLLRSLGRGGFAEVYLGQHIYLDNLAAIKVLHTQIESDDREHFLAEVRIIARLLHPNIVRVLEFGVENMIPFLVMEYAPNGAMRQRHPRGSRLPLHLVVSYVKQIASALQYAHNEKIIHRDIKPENMLLGRNNEVLLSDFGIAIIAQSTLQQDAQEVVGTVAYMAPEQIQGRPRPASDQYSLAVIVYEWLSGYRPFQGSFAETASQQMLVPPPLYGKIAEVSLEIEHVVFTALAKDPQQRFASVSAFANALEWASIQAMSLHKASPVSVSSPVVSDQSLTLTQQPLHNETPPRSMSQPGYNETPPISTPRPIYIQTPPASTPSILSDSYSKPITLLKRAVSGLRRKTGRRIKESQLSLFAIARANLEVSDRAYVNQIYLIEAGISGSKPANFRAEPFDVTIPDPGAPLAFDILIHVSDNIELQDEWHKRITYYLFSPAAQLVRFMFKVVAAGHSSISIDFYHKQRWLRTVRLEFEAVEQPQLSTASSRV